jgi:uncharacterized protein
MDAAINRFICALKRCGIGISPAESIDAMQALTCVNLADREMAKTALRTTLIKDIRDAPVFDEQFDVFFGVAASLARPAGKAEPEVSEAAALPEGKRLVLDTEDDGIAISDTGPARSSESLKIQPGSLEELARNLVVRQAQAMLDQLMQRASHQVNVRAASAHAKPGALNFADEMPTLDADLVLAAIEQLLGDLVELEVDEGMIEQLRAEAASVVQQLPESLRRYLEQQLALKAQSERDIQRRPRAPANQFGEAERREMEEIVRRLGRRMRGARSYRRVVSQRGRIHVARTLRQSMVYDGIPFKPVVTSQRNEKPRIVVICDVSLSVRTTARFMLLLVYSLQDMFDQVRSFVFVSDLADASQHFEQQGIDEAIAAVFSGALIDCDANSNYGQAFDIFSRRHLATVTDQTTVIILGDGRGNRNPPNVAVLEDIRRRAKQLIWLSPEPRGSWGLGSCDMPLYAPVCHRAEVVRNLKQLGEVTESLLGSHGSGVGGFHGHNGMR